MLLEADVIEIINSSLGLSLEIESTPREATLKSLGIDSLDFYNVLVALEEKTGQKILDEDVEGMSNIKKITEYFS